MSEQRSAISQPSIDSLREELFVRAECFLEALDDGRRSDLARLIGRLETAARSLFVAEEELLRRAEDRTLVRHTLEHEKFVDDLRVLAAHAKAGSIAELEALRPAAWLTAWLVAHGRTDGELPARPAGRARAVA